MEENKPAMPENHMVKAILTLLFCCLPFGIVSLIHAAKVDGLYFQGLYDQARHESQEADKYGDYAIWSGVAFYALYFIFIIICVVAEL